MTNYYWDDEKTVVKYQRENDKTLAHQTLPHLCRKDYLTEDQFEIKWNIQYDYDDIDEY